MRLDITAQSRSLAGSSDLTLFAPIRQGLVPSLESVTYKTRIKRLLQSLNTGRGTSLEYALMRPFSDAVERVGRIHSVRVAVIEPGDKVMLAATFDGTWEAYIRVLWQKVGSLLDIIFCDTEDYVTACDHRFEEWEAWARRVQIETQFFYGMPETTVDDVHYLHREAASHLSCPVGATANLAMARHSVGGAESRAWNIAAETSGAATLEAIKQGFQSLAALYRLTDLYLPSTLAGQYFQRAARDLLLEFVTLRARDQIPPPILGPASRRFGKQLTWLDGAPRASDDPHRAAPPLPTERPKFDGDDVQGGIVSGYAGITHGCMLLLAVRDAAAAVGFFTKLLEAVTPESRPPSGAGALAVNVAFSLEGLRAAGLDEAEIALFPQEFREGMEARAGVLGDLRTNHPRRWTLPRRWDPALASPSATETDQIELSSVHVVLQLRKIGPRNAAWIEPHEPREPQEAQGERYVLGVELRDWRTKAEQGGMELLAVEPMQRYLNAAGQIVEHFGFADGSSDPTIDPTRAGRVYRNQVHLGELLLGYENEADWPPDPARSAAPATAQARLAWLRNGSLLVVRKLRQDVAALNQAAEKAAKANGLDADTVLAQMMGRTKEGRPLAQPEIGATNDFDYRDDAEGSKCPFHSHVRRTNPRSAEPGIKEPPGRRTPRIARRGISYGPKFAADPTAERGTVFMAYNASIGEQFEVVQRWISGGNSSGGYSHQSDPFLGVAPNGQQRQFRFEVESEGAAGARAVSVALDGSDDPFGDRRPFVQLQWGAYLFTPSLKTLGRLRDRLARRTSAREPVWSVDDGQRRIEDLLAVEREQGAAAALEAWKIALEDPVEQEKFRSAAIWAAIRERHGGVLATPYGLLVADRDLVMDAFADEKNLSVRGYHQRLQESIGEIYLGLDAGAEYVRLSKETNEAIGKIDRQAAFELSRACSRGVTTGFLDAATKDGAGFTPTDPLHWEMTVDLREIIDLVLGKICHSWFGLPDLGAEDSDIHLEGTRWDADAHRASYPGHFTAPSRDAFQPHPGAEVTRYAREYGTTARTAFRRFVKRSLAAGTWPPLGTPGSDPIVAHAIVAAFKNKANADDLIARTLIGAMMGFLPTTDGNLRRSLNEWLRDGSFWTLRTRWRSQKVRDFDKAVELFEPSLLQAMQLRPSPEVVWRTAKCTHARAGVEVQDGKPVVLAIVSATQQALAAGDSDVYPIFGGKRSPQQPPTHACPGYEAAMGVLLGFVAGLFDIGDNPPASVRASAVPLALIFRGEVAKPPAPTKAEIAAQKKQAKGLEKQAKEHSLALEAKLKAAYAPPKGPQKAATPPGDLIIGLGDSWFHYFAIDIFDVLSFETKLNAVSLAVEGTRLEEMLLSKPEQLHKLSTLLDQQARAGKRPAAILVSAGGNDIVTPKLKELLPPFDSNQPIDEALAKAYKFIGKELRQALRDLIRNVDTRCKAAFGESVPIVVHGYDYPRPDGRGPLGTPVSAWLAPDFDERGYPKDKLALRFAVMRRLIDRLNQMQARIVKNSRGVVHHIDLRKTLRADKNYKTHWENELHPTREGFRLLAEKLAEQIPRK